MMIFVLIFQFTFDTSKLPPCMFNENFQVFGIHIWLKDPNSDTMLCKIINKPEERITTAQTPAPKVTYRPGYGQNIITDRRTKDNASCLNSLSYRLIMLIILSCFFSHHLQL